MNSLFGRLNKRLRAEFEKTVQSGSNKRIFDMLHKYMQFVEDDNESFLHLFLTNNPLDDRDVADEFTREFNKSCLGFLTRTIKNYRKAHPYDSTLAEAQVYMGLAYEFGLFGVTRNRTLAVNYYSAAARQGHPIATFRMGQCFEKGVGKPKNHKHALNFYRCSAKLGYVVGMHIYGSVLVHGDLDNKKDLQSGLFYLKLAVRKADSNYPFPCYDLAQVYETSVGPSEVQPDDAYAFRIYQRGAELGCPNCQYRVAKCYEFGELCQKRSPSFAISWCKRASILGQVDAQVMYSRFLFAGLENVLEPNAERSFFWALKAAVRGHPQAAFCVAECAESGCGTKKSIFLALWWYTVAYEFGNTQAKTKVTMLRHQVHMKNEGTKESKCCGCF